MENLEKTE